MVSVVLPIRNEAPFIKACLERFFDQDPARPHGDPRDRRRLRRRNGGGHARLAGASCKDIRPLENEKCIVPTALNIGIRAARGSIILRTDGHSVPAHDYVSKCVSALTQSGAANVGGVLELIGVTPFGQAVARATGHPLGAGDARYRIGGARELVDTVAVGTFPREVFHDVGLFDASLIRNQDDEMSMRLRAADKRVYSDPTTRVQ